MLSAHSSQNSRTITSVMKNGLCTGCGTCAACCPTEAIQIVKDEKKWIYVPRMDEERCTHCGMCYKVCPGYKVGSEALHELIFDAKPKNPLVGHYLHSYRGHATKREMRYNSSSGGLVTQLLVFALDTGLIDGALVTSVDARSPLEPKPVIARHADEVISAAGSKYCPVAANEAIKEILRRDGKYAVVGLPCQIRAVRKAELINTKLKSRITLHLGIFCGSSSTFGATRFLLKRLGIAETEVQDIKYRCEGWPGHLTVQTSEGKISTDYRDYYDCRFGAFIPWRCTLCSDHTNELADVSFGDAWLPEFADDMTGTSVIISRSDSGEDILHRMLRRNIIDLTPISMDRVIASQNSAILFKKRELSARLKILRLLGKKTPTSSNELRLSPSSRAYLNSITLYSQRILASNEACWPLLNIYCSALKSAGKLRRKLQR